MMNKLLITVGSWEERFKLGYERIINEHDISDVLLFSFKEYADWNKDNLEYTRQIKEYNHIILSFGDPRDSWFKVVEAIAKYDCKDVVLDITTSPRDVVWTVFNLIGEQADRIKCIYNKPEPKGYGEWLSRNPGKPRMVYKLGGELQLGWPTKLLILTGYDAERVKQLIETFEPKETILGYHDGKSHGNQERRVTKEKIKGYESDVRDFEFDAYSVDFGFEKIMSETKSLFEESNVIMASLGPKVTSIPLYMIHKKFLNSSLVYTPSNEFNLNYSKGIGDCVTIDLKELLQIFCKSV